MTDALLSAGAQPTRPWAVDPHDRGDPRDGIPDKITGALKRRGLRVFDLRTAAVIARLGDVGSGGPVRADEHRPASVTEGRVRVRIDDGRWALSPFEASIVTLMIRLDPDLRHANLYADAFCLAAVQAENKVAAVHIGTRLTDAGVRA